MVERLVDIEGKGGQVLHIYPITLDDADADDAAFEAKALEAAAHGCLVPDKDLKTLTARIHISRAGPLTSYGDNVRGDSETKIGLEQAVRERAYELWEQDGRPSDRANEYWHRALDESLRERAYALWQQEGSPDGRADEYWERLVKFQSQ
jgi:hypothetical protein